MSETKKVTRREFLTASGAAGAAAVLAPVLAASTASATGENPSPGGDALPQVPRRVLGKTKESIPILLMGGAVSLDPRFDPKLAEGLRFGVNYIDAADCYGGGTCEPAVGNFHERGKLRDKLWITSKSDEHDPVGFEKTLAASLTKLRTDRVDMYYLHALVDPKFLSSDLEKVVARLKKEGKIRHFGFSCHNDNVVELLTLAAKTPWVDSVMFRYNFRQYGNKDLNQAMDLAHGAGVGLIAMKTQSSEASFPEAWKKFEQTGKWNKFQSVLKAVWADPRITAAVSHMDNLDKVKQNVAAALDPAKLGAREVEAIERYAAATRSLSCDGCDHRCGAAVPSGVRIGDTMRLLMYHDGYGERDRARALFARLPEAARAIGGIDFAAAAAACPYGVDVARHMARAAEVLG